MVRASVDATRRAKSTFIYYLELAYVYLALHEMQTNKRVHNPGSAKKIICESEPVSASPTDRYVWW